MQKVRSFNISFLSQEWLMGRSIHFTQMLHSCRFLFFINKVDYSINEIE